MEMILSENNIHAQTEERITKSLDNQTCLLIKTGDADCIAYFYPALYQLILLRANHETKIDLGYSGSRLLERLLRVPGEVVSREDLMNYAWSDRVVGQGSLNQQIYTLRQILNDEKEREIIQTLPRRGYMWNPKYIDVSNRDESGYNTATPLNTHRKPNETSAYSPALSRATKTQLTPNWNALAQLRLPLVAGFCAITALGIIWVQNHNHTAAQSPFPFQSQSGLTLTYAPESPEQLIQLVPLGEAISEQLESQTHEPLQLVLGSHNKIVTLVCMRTDGSARSVHLHESSIATLSNADLAPCL